MTAIDFELPEVGFTFWNVGTGDTSIISVDEQHVMIVDIRQLSSAAEDDDPRTPVIDYLVEHLPQQGGEPYLSTFVLTHPDQDHCQGFAELLDRVQIGELWFAPRVLEEYDEDLCDDAQAFSDEAERRIGEILEGNEQSGNRVRIIGEADVLKQEPYKGLPDRLLTTPGDSVSLVDGSDLAESFRAFVHAPFKDDAEAERNDTSIGMQVTLLRDSRKLRAVLLGDLSQPTVSRIFMKGTSASTAWDVFLAPHHCSKSAIFVQKEDTEEVDSALMEKIEERGSECRYIIASSEKIPQKNEPGDNPPHAKAKAQYEQIVDLGHFLCTGEHGSKEQLTPVSFSIVETDCGYRDSTSESAAGTPSISRDVAAARGGNQPATGTVRFGQWR